MMKAIQLSFDSWHYKVSKFGGFKHYNGRDFCHYVRCFFAGIAWGALLAALASGFVSFVGTLIYQTTVFLYKWLIVGTFDLNPFVGSSWGVISIVSAIGGGIYLWAKWLERRRYADHEPSFVGMVYRKFKDKTCFKVEFN
jgi:hypothetical protein